MATLSHRVTGGSFQFRVRRGEKRTIAVAERIQVKLNEEVQGVFFNAIERWRRQEFNSRLPTLLGQVFHQRTPAGQHGNQLKDSSLMMMQSATSTAGREGTYLYHMRMQMPGHAAEYGVAQEEGRPEGAAKPKNKYYLVPLMSAFKPPGAHVDVRKELEDPNVWFLPRGDAFAHDRAGRRVKYVFRFKNLRKQGKGAKNKRATNKAAAKVQKKLRGKGTLLFLAYPAQVPGIPGASHGRYMKKVPKLASPLVRNLGFSSVGGAQTSRWFTYSLVKTVPKLDTYLHGQTDKIAGAVRAAMRSGLGGGI